MLIPLDWLKEYVDIKLPLKELMWKMTEAGLTCETVKEIDGKKVLDVEVTANRPDWMSILGVAREVAAIQGLPIKFKEPKNLTKPIKSLPIKLNVDFDLFDRWAGVIMTGIEIKHSPKWLQDKIISMNARPLNNVIDITNYIMYELGIPMHAFDYDEIKGAEMTVKKAKGGEEFTSVDELSYKLPKDAIIIYDKDRLIDLAGIKGGLNSGIKNTTKNIFLHVTIDNPVLIRRTSLKLGLRSEASAIYERMPDKGGVIRALTQAANLVKELAGGKEGSGIIDIKKAKFDPWKITLTQNTLDRVLGISIPEKDVIKILSKLNLSPKKVKGGTICTIPTYRGDLKIEEDLAEEVARIYGYNKFPTSLPEGETNAREIPYYFDDSFILRLKEDMVSAGYMEAMTLSLISKDLIEKTNGRVSDNVKLVNPVSSDYEYLRTSLVPSLLAALKLNAGDTLKLFEIDKVYKETAGKYEEIYKLAAISKGLNFREFKGVIDMILNKLNIEKYDVEFDSNKTFIHPSVSGSIVTGKHTLIDYGQLHPEVKEKLQINGGVFLFEADIKLLKESSNIRIFKSVPDNPPQIEDITFRFPAKTRLGEVVKIIKGADSKVTEVVLTSTFEDNYTFRIWYQDPAKTLTNKDVEKIRTEILSSVKTKFGGTFRD